MRLPFAPPLAPMLSSAADVLPAGQGWQFEPKWDGFRTLVFRDGDEVLLQSRDEKPMNRYFPELIAPLQRTLPERCVVDGEVVIVGAGGLDFEALLLRIHPAASRVKLLAAESPASFVAWDLLALGDEDLRQTPLAERRERLERALGDAEAPVHLSPATRDRALAEDWFRRFEGAGLDGVMAKRLDEPYRAGERTMIKIKHSRTADCVVAGFPWHDWAEAESAAAAAGQRMPGASSRWNRGKDLSWEPLRPERVCEVAYDHMQGTRFRHATHFLRWRPDKPPAECRYDQLEERPAYELAKIFTTPSAGRSRDRAAPRAGAPRRGRRE